MQNRENILIYRIGQLGDTIVLFPVFQLVRKLYYDSTIYYLNSKHENKPFVKPENILPKSLIDCFLEYEYSDNLFIKLSNSFKLFLSLRKYKFSTLIYLAPRARRMSSRIRDILFFKLCGVKKIIGTKGFEKLDFKNLPLKAVKNELEHFLERLELSGIDVSNCKKQTPNLFLTNKETRWGDKWYSDNFEKENNKALLIGVSPYSKSNSKTWPLERFEKLINLLIEKYKIYPIVFGGENDWKESEKLLNKWKRRGINLAGRTSIRESASILRKCSCFIGVDSGCMHLAASVRVPCVIAFSAQDLPNRWYPLGDSHKIIRKQVPCEGCCRSKCEVRGHPCMEKISVEEMFNACSVILKKVNLDIEKSR